MLLSRVAERVYWMGRYLERTENIARLISVHTSLLMDVPDDMEFNWFTSVRIFNAEALYEEQYDEVTENNVMRFLVTDKENPGSLISSLVAARENVRTSLDVLPEETWEQVNQVYMLMKKSVATVESRRLRQALLRKVIMHCQCIRGVLDSHMSRDNTFHFVQLGKHVERADMTSRILESASLLLPETRSQSIRKYEGILWMALLQALSAHQMYLKHKRPPVKGQKVLDFLIHDSLFPRSLIYSLDAVGIYLRELPNPHKAITLQQQITENLHEADVLDSNFHPVMDDLQEQLGALHAEIAGSWFYPDFSMPPMQSQSQSQSQV